MRKLFIIGFTLSVLAFAPQVHAENGPACDPSRQSVELCNPVRYASNAEEFMIAAIQVITGFFLLAGLLRIVFAGFRMMTSQGNEEAVTAGRNALQWSIAGIILALFAFVIIAALREYLQVRDLNGISANIVPQNPIQSENFGALLTRMLIAFLEAVGLVAIFMILFGGFKYITAGGNEEQAQSAKGTLQWAVTGLAVILLSYVITRATLTFFGA